jgi:hypothetical protein
VNKPTPEALQQMRDRGGLWAAYENHALDSADLGHLRFLKYGPDCTLKEPPQRYPDTSLGVGWKYVYIGTVNLETGEVDPKARVL